MTKPEAMECFEKLDYRHPQYLMNLHAEPTKEGRNYMILVGVPAPLPVSEMPALAALETTAGRKGTLSGGVPGNFTVTFE